MIKRCYTDKPRYSLNWFNPNLYSIYTYIYVNIFSYAIVRSFCDYSRAKTTMGMVSRMRYPINDSILCKFVEDSLRDALVEL